MTPTPQPGDTWTNAAGVVREIVRRSGDGCEVRHPQTDLESLAVMSWPRDFHGFKLETRMRKPAPGDVWHRDDAFMTVLAVYVRDEQVVGADVQHSDDRDGVTSDVLWPDGFDGWQPGVCRATALADRPPTPERDERSEVERLREELAEVQAAFTDASDSADELSKAIQHAWFALPEALRKRDSVTLAQAVRAETAMLEQERDEACTQLEAIGKALNAWPTSDIVELAKATKRQSDQWEAVHDKDLIPRADVVRALRELGKYPRPFASWTNALRQVGHELGITDDELRDAREGGE
tara:strand:+ start:140 stop:1024 length:885 start_codon:yes stop_codon:yes gene_type:complete